MKKIEFFFLAAVAFIALCTTTHFLSSCSEDFAEEQEQQLTKADILRAKAKEFAKMYNVDMTLNEEDIDSLAEILTVEQMERDFQEFASMKITCSHLPNSTCSLIPHSKRLKIRKALKLSEEKKNKETRSGSVTQDISISLTFEKFDQKGNRYTENIYFNGEAKLNWVYEGEGQGTASIEIESHNDDNIEGGTTLHPLFVGGLLEETVSFTASGDITLTSKGYSVTKRIYVSFTEPYSLNISIS